MNPESQNSQSSFLPVFLSSLALLIFFIWQLSLVWGQKSAMSKVEEAQKPVVARALQAQTELQGLATDLLALAKTDSVAQQIVTAYGIAQSGAAPATQTAPAAPAAPKK